MEIQDHQENQVLLVFQEEEEELEEMVHLDQLVPMVIVVNKVFQDRQAPQVHLGLKDNAATVVILVRPEAKVLLVAQVVQEKLEHKETEDHQVHRENLVDQENKVLG